MVHLPANRFHRHSLMQLFARSVQLLRQEWVGYTKLAAVMVVPSIFLNAIYFEHMHEVIASYFQAMQQSAQNRSEQNEATQEFFANMQETLAGPFWFALLLSLLGIVIKAAMIRTTAQAFVPVPVTIKKNLHHGLNRLPHMICWCFLFILGWMVYSIVVGVAVALIIILLSTLINRNVGFLAYIVLQVANVFLSYYIILVLVFCMPAIVVERVSAWKSFTRAWDMAKGHRCMILCAQMGLLLAALVVFGLEFALFARFGWTVLAVVNGLTSLFWVPLATILISLLYLNVRIDKEGLNIQVLTAELNKGDTDMGLKMGGENVSYEENSSSYEPIVLDDEQNKHDLV